MSAGPGAALPRRSPRPARLSKAAAPASPSPPRSRERCPSPGRSLGGAEMHGVCLYRFIPGLPPPVLGAPIVPVLCVCVCDCGGGGRICTIQGLTESVPREVSTPMLWPVFLHTVGALHDLDWIRAPGRYRSRGAMRERPRPWLCGCVWPSSRVRPRRAVPGEEGPGRAAVVQRVGGLVVPPPPASLEHVAETQTLGLPCTCSEDKGPRCSGAGRSLGPSHGVCREPQ